MFPLIGRLLDDMIGVVKKFQASGVKVMPWRFRSRMVIWNSFSSSLMVVLRLGWAMNKASAAAEMELCFDNSTM